MRLYKLHQVGLFFGSFIFGYLGDKIGRKKTLVIAILTSCGGSLIGAFCGSSYVAYTITRFVTAVGKFKVPIFREGHKKYYEIFQIF